jgi:phosphotransferase system enzyme I (PtsI)
LPIIEEKITDIEGEIKKFKRAIEKTEKEILTIQRRFLEETDSYHAAIFDAQVLFLNDKEVINGAIDSIRKGKRNAESAFGSVVQKYVTGLRKTKDRYLRERVSDIKDVATRVIHNISERSHLILSFLKERRSVIAHDLAPSDTAFFSKDKVSGVATNLGGKTSHMAIMARALEIPAVVGLENITKFTEERDTIIIDGNRGVVIIEPDESTLRTYEKKMRRFQLYTDELKSLAELPAITLDGHTIELSANIELPIEIDSALSHGAKGIGLYRTEFLYINGFPSEEEQLDVYRNCARKVYPNSVIIRTLDMGGDKLLPVIGDMDPNPFLGWRAIRFSLKERDIFKTQLRAILRAGKYGKVKLMFPMVSSVQEVRAIKEIIEEVKRDLINENIDFDPDIELGAMIEIPSAAISARTIAKEVNFLSIGSNDLTQYTLAVDRTNPRVANLFKPLHPSVLRLIKNTIDGGHSENIWVGLCGELGGNPIAVPILIGLGIDELSIASMAILEAKKMIRHLSMKEAKNIARKALDLETPKEIEELVKKTVKFPGFEEMLKEG